MSAFTESMIAEALKTTGWGAFEDLPKKAAADNARERDAALAEAGIVNAAMSTPEGQKFLQWLLGKTLLRGPSNEELGARTADAYAIAKARREGQNGVVFNILQALEVARNGR